MLLTHTRLFRPLVLSLTILLANPIIHELLPPRPLLRLLLLLLPPLLPVRCSSTSSMCLYQGLLLPLLLRRMLFWLRLCLHLLPRLLRRHILLCSRLLLRRSWTAVKGLRQSKVLSCAGETSDLSQRIWQLSSLDMQCGAPGAYAICAQIRPTRASLGVALHKNFKGFEVIDAFTLA